MSLLWDTAPEFARSVNAQHHVSRKLCLYFKLKKKEKSITWYRGSAVECALSDDVAPSSIPEMTSFWWIGFCARDCFKHSEAKWSLLPSLFSEALDTGTTVYKSGTLILVESSLRAFFCQSPVASTWPWAGLSRDHFIQHRLILESATPALIT